MDHINEKSYRELIQQDVEKLNEAMPNDSLEKKHIISILNWSIKELYKDGIESVIFLDISELPEN